MKKLSASKEALLKKAMKDFDNAKGGTEVLTEFTSNPDLVTKQLEESFDELFPELSKQNKCRKHIILDEDVLELFEDLKSTKDVKLSNVVNMALRSYLKTWKEKQNSLKVGKATSLSALGIIAEVRAIDKIMHKESKIMKKELKDELLIELEDFFNLFEEKTEKIIKGEMAEIRKSLLEQDSETAD